MSFQFTLVFFTYPRNDIVRVSISKYIFILYILTSLTDFKSENHLFNSCVLRHTNYCFWEAQSHSGGDFLHLCFCTLLPTRPQQVRRARLLLVESIDWNLLQLQKFIVWELLERVVNLMKFVMFVCSFEFDLDCTVGCLMLSCNWEHRISFKTHFERIVIFYKTLQLNGEKYEKNSLGNIQSWNHFH